MRRLLVAVVAMATVGGVLPQCLTDYHQKGSQINTDLSGVTDFGLDLYRQLSPATSPENFFFSPYSIWTVLSLAYLGTAGNTKLQMEAPLRITDKVSTYNLMNALENLYRSRANKPGYTFRMANRVYYDSSLRIQPCIQDLLPDELKEINFGNPGGAASAINNFVSNTTNGRIKQIVSVSDMEQLVMALVNAAYFKGTWLYQFHPKSTVTQDFKVTERDNLPVNMMRLKSKLRYGHSQELKAEVLDLPYSGGDVSMVLLLPEERGPQGFAATVNALSGARLRQVITDGLRNTDVELRLPKFKLEHTIKDQLKQGLRNMGIRDLFSPGLADLSEFVRYTPLFVKKAIHKAFVEVNEEGTEAAAATVVGAAVRTAHSGKAPPIRFHCDRPFIFLIHDNFTKNVLFFGAYKNPV